jgi:hypothetical protein
VSITNESRNGVIGVGFEGRYATNDAGPTGFALNGMACTTG